MVFLTNSLTLTISETLFLKGFALVILSDSLFKVLRFIFLWLSCKTCKGVFLSVLMGLTLFEERSRRLDFQRRILARLTHDGAPWDYPIKCEFVISACISSSRRGFGIKRTLQILCLVFWDARTTKSRFFPTHLEPAQRTVVIEWRRICGSPQRLQTYFYKTLFLSPARFTV